ncbi:PMEI domain-containing protein [Forsythia ovata]|uniref:PMEI domain-containing protein n=1 Tax=Forsythia ovata TaxID=205694 RepID=A0ABD1TTB5_9LAMI
MFATMPRGLRECLEAMQKSVEDVSFGDFFKANVDVSAFSTNIDTCDECFNEMIDPEFQKFDDWARGVASDCLDKIVKYSKHILDLRDEVWKSISTRLANGGWNFKVLDM